MADQLLAELLKNIESEFAELSRQFADKEAQSERLKRYIGSLGEQMKKLWE